MVLGRAAVKMFFCDFLGFSVIFYGFRVFLMVFVKILGFCANSLKKNTVEDTRKYFPPFLEQWCLNGSAMVVPNLLQASVFKF